MSIAPIDHRSSSFPTYSLRFVTNQHPNILRPSFSQESDELVYYAMPRIKGMSLTKLLETSGALSVKEAVTILSGVGRGLHHAHTNGVIHRDIKQSNITIEPGSRSR